MEKRVDSDDDETAGKGTCEWDEEGKKHVRNMKTERKEEEEKEWGENVSVFSSPVILHTNTYMSVSVHQQLRVRGTAAGHSIQQNHR